MVSERTSIGFGGGEVCLVNMTLKTATDAWEKHRATGELWTVVGEYVGPHETRVKTDLVVINPDQVKVLQRL